MAWVGLILLATLVTVAFIVIIAIFFLLIKQWQLQDQMRRVTLYRGKNDNEFAKELLLKLIAAAEQSLEIFDDGDIMERSIYMDEDVVNAVQEKLRTIPNFRLDCWFNKDANTLFKNKLVSTKGVNIRCPSKAERPVMEKHYKIVDNGLLVYISEHQLGSTERTYDFYNCKKVNQKYLKDIVKLRFGDMLSTTREKFA